MEKILNQIDLPDVDIDTGNRDRVLEVLPNYINASLEDDKKHNTGVYVTPIPFDPISNIATINYKEAEARGYIKLDILNVYVYDGIKDEEHLVDLISKKPNWERLWTDQEFCEKIIHINKHHDLIKQMKPDSVPRMAMFLSVIRPAKRHLIGKSWDEIAETVWEKPNDDAYYFKKSHSVSYAMLVQVHMNLVEENEIL